jgi:hypothetical protein
MNVLAYRFRIQNLRFRVWDFRSGFRINILAYRIKNLRIRAWDLRFWI